MKTKWTIGMMAGIAVLLTLQANAATDLRDAIYIDCGTSQTSKKPMQIDRDATQHDGWATGSLRVNGKLVSLLKETKTTANKISFQVIPGDFSELHLVVDVDGNYGKKGAVALLGYPANGSEILFVWNVCELEE